MGEHYLERELRSLLRDDPSVFDWFEASCLDGLWFCDLENQDQEEWLSPTFKALFGYTDDEVPNAREWRQANIFPEDLSTVEAALRDHLETGAPFDQIVRYRHRDGHPVWVRCRGRAVRDAAGKPTRMLCGHTDVSELMADRDRAADKDQALARSYEQLELAVSGADLGLWDWNILEDTKVLSDTWLALLGLTRDELTGTSLDWSLRVHPQDMIELKQRLDDHFRSGEPRFQARYRMRHADGEWRWMMSNGAVVEYDAKGQARRMVGIMRDVSHEVAIENELRLAASQAEAAARAKSDFLATMSHEISTPLNGVLGMTEVLLKCPLKGAAREYAQTIHHSGEMLLTVINDVLDFAKAEAGKLVLEKEPFDPRALVDDTITLFSADVSKRGIELSALVDAQVPGALAGDETRLRQILNNLLSNALKFTERGEIEVNLLPQRVGGRPGIELTVSDTGIGMSPMVQENIFSAFIQGESSTTRRYGGTGLGLAIVHRLVELMGGEITVESREGFGTTMRVRLPMDSTPQVPTQHRDTSLLQGKLVLHVDDNPVNLRIVSELCSSWGIEVTSCADSIQALRQLRSKSKAWDCLISDLQMPDIDGMMLLNLIQGDPDIPELPVILLSSGSSITDRHQARSFGFAALVTKPIRQAKLLAALLSVFSTDGRLEPEEDEDDGPQRPHVGRLLVVEDNEVNRQLISLQLVEMVDELVTACDGMEALARVTTESFDLIIMDCQMPNMDGFAATRAIRAHERDRKLRPTPIVALTANIMPGYRERCTQAGMDDFLTKPTKLTELHEVLFRWCGGGPPQGDPRSKPSTWSSQTLAAFQLLQRSVGTTGLRELINVSLKAFARLRATMEQAMAKGDLKRIGLEANSVKGSAAGLGLTQLAELSGRLQASADAGDIRRCRGLLGDWLQAIDHGRELLEEMAGEPDLLGREAP